jgi:pyrroline-5-carboxylate reductase
MDLHGKRLGIVGAGNMGAALMRGILKAGALTPEQIIITTRRPDRAQRLSETYGVQSARDNISCATQADIVMFAVKPQIMENVLQDIGPHFGNRLGISVAAGVSTHTMELALGGAPRVIRSMPNTPALIQQGATAVSKGAHATDEDLELAAHLLRQAGRVVTVEESLLDAVTGLSGSGPAYIFLIIEAFADAGVKVGLSREVAMELAVQTIQGSARMVQETGQHPGQLKDQVTSPGGTAIAGLHTLEEGGLRTTIMNAVEAATRRANELGRR